VEQQCDRNDSSFLRQRGDYNYGRTTLRIPVWRCWSRRTSAPRRDRKKVMYSPPFDRDHRTSHVMHVNYASRVSLSEGTETTGKNERKARLHSEITRLLRFLHLRSSSRLSLPRWETKCFVTSTRIFESPGWCQRVYLRSIVSVHVACICVTSHAFSRVLVCHARGPRRASLLKFVQKVPADLSWSMRFREVRGRPTVIFSEVQENGHAIIMRFNEGYRVNATWENILDLCQEWMEIVQDLRS